MLAIIICDHEKNYQKSSSLFTCLLVIYVLPVILFMKLLLETLGLAPRDYFLSLLYSENIVRRLFYTLLAISPKLNVFSISYLFVTGRLRKGGLELCRGDTERDKLDVTNVFLLINSNFPSF